MCVWYRFHFLQRQNPFSFCQGIFFTMLTSGSASANMSSLHHSKLWDFHFGSSLLLDVKNDCQCETFKAHTPRDTLVPGSWNAIRSSVCLLCSYQLLQDERLSIQQPQRKKTSPFRPRCFSYQRGPSSHTTTPGQTAIKTSGLGVERWALVNHRSIKLISIRSPHIDTAAREASTVWTARSP